MKNNPSENEVTSVTKVIAKSYDKFVFRRPNPDEISALPEVRVLDRRDHNKYVPMPCMSPSSLELEEGCPNFGGGNDEPTLREWKEENLPEDFDEVLNVLVERQPIPLKNTHPAVADLVMSDMRDRDQFGEKKYGTRLQPFNGRDPNVDLYQELLDAVQYQRQVIYERTFELQVIDAALKYIQHQDSNRVHDLFNILQSTVTELLDARKSMKQNEN